ncbi:high mobility group nucleosome-binding domain-containing protein 5-like [Gigantopelta aegis]|uniref:high mobility group nucleosome-binding domain-containing protein 5-like n=1 Tax=Gigantopelta aegis TaxID=1735272 RepID=UPI001B88C409|nr:high mobility group nucleosome-binding domain-containing protein 5-like [Gigantopelta aegis]
MDMEVETRDFSIEKIISDIDKDLSCNGENVDQVVVYKNTESENGDPVMVMQLHEDGDSDADDAGGKKTTEEEVTMNRNAAAIVEEEKEETEMDVRPSQTGDGHQETEMKANSGKETSKMSTQKGRSQSQEKTVIEVDDDEEKDDEEKDDDVDRLTDYTETEKSKIDGKEDSEDVEENDVEKNGADDVVSVSEKGSESSGQEPTRGGHGKSMSALQTVSVLIKKLDYFSMSKTGINVNDVLEATGGMGARRIVHTDSDYKRKVSDSKKDPGPAEREENVGQNLHQVRRKDTGMSNTKPKVSDGVKVGTKKSKTKCLTCFLYIHNDVYKEHIDEHTREIMALRPSKRGRHGNEHNSDLEDVQQTPKDDLGKGESSGKLKEKNNGRRFSKSSTNDDKHEKGSSKKPVRSKAKDSTNVEDTPAKDLFICDKCGTSCSSSRDLRHHKMDHEAGGGDEKEEEEEEEGCLIVEESSDTEERQDADREKTRLWCDQCRRTFSTQSNFNIHMEKVHTVDKDSLAVSSGDRKRKASENLGSGIPSKRDKSGVVSSSSSRQQTPTSKKNAVGATTDLLRRTSRNSPLSPESLVILPFVDLSLSKTSTISSSCSAVSGNPRPGTSGTFVSPGSSFSGYVNFSSLGKPREVRRETVRKYSKQGEFGEEEIIETVTEIW